MGIFSEKLNGAAILNIAGSEKLQEFVTVYMKKNGIHPNHNVIDEPWYREMKKELFHPDYEGIYWSRTRILSHQYDAREDKIL
ncbi:hypothetical protein ACFQ88_24020 [Paenibacillus sp. NPDC056579]|uniref:hypothetical protein n=1 Tax=Paenibacillus sp. NPDC056579 TaxID=3345871 RepID=UPI003689DBD1